MRRTLVILGILVLTLLAVGFVVLTSASGASGIRLHGGNRYYFAVQQAKWLGIALFAFAAAALVDYRTWRDRPWLTVALYIAVCALSSRYTSPRHAMNDIGSHENSPVPQNRDLMS